MAQKKIKTTKTEQIQKINPGSGRQNKENEKVETMSLDNIRKKIDLKDAQILELLHERMELALMSRKFKSTVEDRVREDELLKRIQLHSGTLLGTEFCEGLYRQIIAESKRLQQGDYKIIGFQGEHGAYAEIAAKHWNPTYVTSACPGWTDVFEGVMSGVYDYGIVPIENTLGGVVEQTNDLLIHSDVSIVGAVELTIHQCLLTLPETDHREIRVVYSHQQALAQCRNFLARNRLEGVPWYNTAGAAKMLMTEKPKATAVIASHTTAELYNLEIIKENIEDNEANRTRFIVISKNHEENGGDKCSILFSTANTHKAGVLFKVLEVFANENISLSRIESIPDTPGNYVFQVDLLGSRNDENVKRALEQIVERTSKMRFMGCYKEISIR